ncbi:MAG: hypothetical protein NVS3B14_01270 [Ktedonobacteraceae bacterium]
MCGLVLFLSGCVSLFSGTGGNNTHTTSPPLTVTDLTSVTNPSPTPLSDSQLAAALVKSMSLDDKLGQMVIVEFYGSTLNADLMHMIQVNRIGGVLIENKNGNAVTRQQLVSLNQSMQAQTRVPLFVSTDYEGGLVNELVRITGPRPSEATIGATHDPTVAYNAGLNDPGLPDRTFGSDSQLVTQMGQSYLKGLTDGGVVGCLKHFPGLGSATIDPHYSLPIMNRSLATLNAVDFVPYRTMINEGIVPMVMVTHILNPQLDPNLPTSLSPKVVTGLLRDQLHFNGVIISDTLWMGGISNTYSLSQAAILAVKAGIDLILGPRGLQDTVTMLASMKQALMNGQLSMDAINASVQRIIEMKLHYKILTHNQALQLLDNNEALRHHSPCVNGCTTLTAFQATADADVRRQAV